MKITSVSFAIPLHRQDEADRKATGGGIDAPYYIQMYFSYCLALLLALMLQTLLGGIMCYK